MTTQPTAIALTKANLDAIFAERDADQRMASLSALWAADPLFVDATGVYKTHRAISEVVDKILAMGGEHDVFTELGDVECLQKDDEADLWVTRVRWGVGPKDASFNLTGTDVVTITGGKIKACYTFLDAM